MICDYCESKETCTAKTLEECKIHNEKAKTCLCCGLPLTEKEANENPELLCDEGYSIGEIDETNQNK